MPVPGARPAVLLLLLASLLAASPAPAEEPSGTPPPPAEGVAPEALPGDELFLFAEEERVSASSRKVSKLSEAPGTITVLSRKRLLELGVVTLGDAIQYITSVFFYPGSVAETAQFRDIQQPFNNKILLLQDGRIVNAVYRGNFFLDLSQPVQNVQQLEIVRGPGSALYGANAFAGFINIVTRKGADLDGAEVWGGVGTDGLAMASGSAGGTTKDGKLDWVVTGRTAVASGPDIVNPEDENADHSDWNLEGRVGGKLWSAAGGFTRVNAGVPGSFAAPTPFDSLSELRGWADGHRLWETSRKTKMKLRAYWNEARNKYYFRVPDLATGAGDLCTDPETGLPSLYCALTSEFRNSNVFFIVDPALTPLSPAELQQYGVRKEDLYAQAEAGDPETFVSRAVWDRLFNGTTGSIVEQTSDERSILTEYQFDWQISKQDYLLAGANVKWDWLENSGVGDHEFRNYAVFVENEARFLDDTLLFLASLRGDWHSAFGSTLSPRASLIWVPNRRYTLKSSYGNAFRAPNFVELYGEEQIGLTTQRGNPDLEREQIQTIEVQFEYERSRKLRTVLTLYHYQIKDEVVYITDFDKVFGFDERPSPPFPPGTGDLVFDEALAAVPVSSTFRNASGSRGVGAELEISGEPREGIFLWGNYSRRETTQAVEYVLVPTGETRVVYNTLIQVLEPRVVLDWFLVDQANLGGHFRLGKRAFLDYRLRIIGNPGDSIFDRDARFSHDMTFGWDRGGFSLRATGLNIGGADYLRDRGTGTVPNLERRLLLAAGYTWRF